MGSGDNGVTIDVYAETEDSNVSPWKKTLPSKFMGWNVIAFRCPKGYIKPFFQTKPVERD